ncbi:beta-eliminating lyase-related protein [Streptomyces sp. NPDC023998]|uniref:threonine aldolase family protein n=1 Tax=Streptomyces sp. NPDC023998 TaxID=3154597 RepID=UPI0033CA5977
MDMPKESREQRALAAVRGSNRVLPGAAGGETIAERLARLVESAPRAYDLNDFTDAGGGGVVAELERRTASLLGMEEAAFFPTGTMAQQIGLRCWAGRTGRNVVAAHPLAHLEVHERGAFASVSGLRPVHPTKSPRNPTAEEVRGLDEPFGTLVLELPMRDAGFILPTWEELSQVAEAARERGAAVHFDGARLWDCGPHFGRTLAELAGLADSVYVSYYKSLDGISGAALAGPSSLIDEARAWRHRYGGTLYQQWPAALAALAGLDQELPRIPAYVAHAKTIASALREALTDRLPWARVYPEVPHTHQFQVWVPYSAEIADEASLRLAEETKTLLFPFWAEPGPPGTAMAEMTVSSTALEWTPDDVDAAIAQFIEIAEALDAGSRA